MDIQQFYDEVTSMLTYVVYDEASRTAVVIDPIRDFDPKSGRTAWTSAERVAQFLRPPTRELAGPHGAVPPKEEVLS